MKKILIVLLVVPCMALGMSGDSDQSELSTILSIRSKVKEIKSKNRLLVKQYMKSCAVGAVAGTAISGVSHLALPNTTPFVYRTLFNEWLSLNAICVILGKNGWPRWDDFRGSIESEKAVLLNNIATDLNQQDGCGRITSDCITSMKRSWNPFTVRDGYALDRLVHIDMPALEDDLSRE